MYCEAASQAIHEIALDIWHGLGLSGAPDLETQMAAYDIYRARHPYGI
jgi:hypothetical protein